MRYLTPVLVLAVLACGGEPEPERPEVNVWSVEGLGVRAAMDSARAHPEAWNVVQFDSSRVYSWGYDALTDPHRGTKGPETGGG